MVMSVGKKVYSGDFNSTKTSTIRFYPSMDIFGMYPPTKYCNIHTDWKSHQMFVVSQDSAHLEISFALWSSPWMSVIELSPLLRVSAPIRSLLLSLVTLVLLMWASDVTTFASVPRSPWDGSSCTEREQTLDVN